MAISYTGSACELREVVLRDKPTSMLNYSAKGTVPVLVLPNRVVDESLDVMLWALNRNDPDGWLNVNCAEADDLIRQSDEEFKPILDRYKYHECYPEQTQLDYRQAAEPYLTALNLRLAKQPWLMGARLSIVDVAVMPFIRQFAHVDKPWFEQSTHTHLTAWLNGFLRSELFRSVMGKYGKWQPGGEIVLFPDGTRGESF